MGRPAWGDPLDGHPLGVFPALGNRPGGYPPPAWPHELYPHRNRLRHLHGAPGPLPRPPPPTHCSQGFWRPLSIPGPPPGVSGLSPGTPAGPPTPHCSRLGPRWTSPSKPWASWGGILKRSHWNLGRDRVVPHVLHPKPGDGPIRLHAVEQRQRHLIAWVLPLDSRTKFQNSVQTPEIEEKRELIVHVDPTS